MKCLDFMLLLFAESYCGQFVNNSFEILELLLSQSGRKKFQEENNLKQTYFSSLENYQVNAIPVSEQQYPWVARVVHSRTLDIPHMCTAICIDEGIFITAARCIYSLRPKYTTVIYLKRRLSAIAFVLPSETTKQLYDDIGFIVVDQSKFDGVWPVLELFGRTNRTDNKFKWFSSLEPSFGDYKVIGYATKKGIHRIKSADRQFDLTELDIVIGMDICSKILTFYGKIDGFTVPCYHSCTVEQFIKKAQKCSSYHGVEGGAVFDAVSNKLIGVATWGAYYTNCELPVGFSVPNSINFFNDYSCARRISADNRENRGAVGEEYYQRLCDIN